MKYSPSPRRQSRLRHAVLWAAAFPALLLAACLQQEVTWPAVKQLIRERFPEVPQVSTAELSEWLAAPGGTRPLLLDARESEEFAVSHLPGALLATSEDQALAWLQDAEQDRLIVTYCAVGYRSAALAQRLIARGFTNVHNLEGSIFAWANEGRPVYRGEQ